MSSWSKRKTPIPTKSSTTLSSCSRPHPFRRNLKNATYHPRIRSITRRSGATSRAPARVGKRSNTVTAGPERSGTTDRKGHTLSRAQAHLRYASTHQGRASQVSWNHQHRSSGGQLWLQLHRGEHSPHPRLMAAPSDTLLSGCRDCRTPWAHHRLSACETSAPSKSAFP